MGPTGLLPAHEHHPRVSSHGLSSSSWCCLSDTPIKKKKGLLTPPLDLLPSNCKENELLGVQGGGHFLFLMVDGSLRATMKELVPVWS